MPEGNDDLQAWAAQHDDVAIGSFAAAAEAGEIVVLATRGTAVEAGDRRPPARSTSPARS